MKRIFVIERFRIKRAVNLSPVKNGPYALNI